jgi:hypothetical protein
MLASRQGQQFVSERFRVRFAKASSATVADGSAYDFVRIDERIISISDKIHIRFGCATAMSYRLRPGRTFGGFGQLHLLIFPLASHPDCLHPNLLLRPVLGIDLSASEMYPRN